MRTHHRLSITLITCALLTVIQGATGQTGPDAGAANALVRRALESNGELAAARLDVDRARARLVQAGLRPNPTFDMAQSSGTLVGSEPERDLSVAVALPFELGGKRDRRIELAEVELAATGAEVADRERRLVQQVLAAYAEALAASRDLEITDGVEDLDQQTVRVIRTRVEQQDAAPLELNLLQTEVARIRSQRALAQGRLDAALATLRTFIGAGPGEALPLGDPRPVLEARPVDFPPTMEAAVTVALENRPDLSLARLNERVAEAGLDLSRAIAVPDLTVSAALSITRDFLRPEGGPSFSDTSRALTFGVSLPLPFFNRNQGGITDAALAIEQARRFREFTEQTVRTEVTGAYQRLRAAEAAAEIFEQSVATQATDNLRVIQAAYQLGEFRITDVITQQRQFLEAGREYASTLAERYRAAVDLEAAMGQRASAQSSTGAER